VALLQSFARRNGAPVQAFQNERVTVQFGLAQIMYYCMSFTAVLTPVLLISHKHTKKNET
jgi:hypothetical protein